MVMAGKVTDSWTACLRSFCAAIRMSAAFLRSASESMGASVLQLSVDLEARLGLFLDLVHRHAGRELGQHHAAAVAVDAEDAQVGDHHIDHAGAGERQIALV